MIFPPAQPGRVRAGNRMVITLYELAQALGVSHVDLIAPDDQV